MTNVFVMIGLPGSGKSYRANKLFFELCSLFQSAVHISSDNYRKRLLGDVNDQSRNAYIFDTLYKDFEKYLKDDAMQNIILDMTNTTVKGRKRIFEVIRKVSPDMEDVNVTAYVVAPPLEEVIKQDSSRERVVGEHVIKKFLSSFQFPQKFEGFNHIWVNDYREKNMPVFNKAKLAELKYDMSLMDQHNPHHKYTLGKHCDNVADAALTSNHCKWSPMVTAGDLHDVGKMFTQTFDEAGIAHYYNHDCVGAYYLASHLEILVATCWDDIFEELFLVNYHMRAHNDFTHEKAEKKYRTLFGDELFDKLMQFGEYDRIASGTYKEVCNE